MEPRRERAVLAAILAASVLLPAVFFLGPRSVDGFLTVEYAARIRDGSYAPQLMPQTMRLGMLLPTALFQALFGVNGFSSVLWSVLMSALHALAAWAVGRTLVSPAAGLAAAGAVALLPIQTIYATALYPDVPAAALGGAAFALLLGESRRETARLGPVLAAGALLGGAYLVKQTVVLLVGFLALWMLPRGRRRLAWAAAPFAAVVAVEALVFWGLTGDPLYRSTTGNAFLATFVTEVVSDWSQGFWTTYFFAFPWGLLAPQAMIWTAGLAWAAIAGFAAGRKEPWARLLGAMVAVELILATVWPARLSPYVPALLRHVRHIAPLFLPLAVLAGAGWARLGPRLRVAGALAYAAAALTATFLLWEDHAARDAGEREAIRVLKRAGAVSIRATDPFGNSPELVRYAFGYAPSVSAYAVEDLPGLRATWVWIDDRAAIPGAGGRRPAAALEIPATWELAWSGTFSPLGAWRRRLVSEPDAVYRLRLYRAP